MRYFSSSILTLSTTMTCQAEPTCSEIFLACLISVSRLKKAWTQADIAKGETNLKLILVHFKRQFIYEYLTSLQEHHYYEVGKNVNRIDNLPIGNSDIILFGVSSTFSIESMQSNCSLNSIDL